jgi:hypothetical protein
MCDAHAGVSFGVFACAHPAPTRTAAALIQIKGSNSLTYCACCCLRPRRARGCLIDWLVGGDSGKFFRTEGRKPPCTRPAYVCDSAASPLNGAAGFSCNASRRSMPYWIAVAPKRPRWAPRACWRRVKRKHCFCAATGQTEGLMSPSCSRAPSERLVSVASIHHAGASEQ